MTDILKQIQAKIDEAAKSYGQKDAKELFTQMEEARCFRIGAAYLMPVIKLLLKQRDECDAELYNQDYLNHLLLELLNKDDK